VPWQFFHAGAKAESSKKGSEKQEEGCKYRNIKLLREFPGSVRSKIKHCILPVAEVKG
jgi:hypothetical protein